MARFPIFALIAGLLLLNANLTYAETLRGGKFTIETLRKSTPPPPAVHIQTGFTDKKNAKPLRLNLSADLIDFGPLTPTNPIKRHLNISVDEGSAKGFTIFALEDHPLAEEKNVIPDTTCDDGTCSEKKGSLWLNPFTFGFGFSFDDRNYQQFADASKKEPMTQIEAGKITLKLNISQNQPLSQNAYYENTIVFLLIPKF